MALGAACALLKVPVCGHLGSGMERTGTGLGTEFPGAVAGGVWGWASARASVGGWGGPSVARAECLAGRTKEILPPSSPNKRISGELRRMKELLCGSGYSGGGGGKKLERGERPHVQRMVS